MSPWKEATASSDDQDMPVWGKDIPKDTPIEGVYVSSKTVKIKDKDTQLYTVTTEKYPKGVKVWGDKVIASRLEEIPEGSKVRLEFLGKKKGENFEYNDYKILFDDSNLDQPKLEDIA